MTICWTSDDCDGQVDLKLHLSVGQVILFPYFDHCMVPGIQLGPYHLTDLEYAIYDAAMFATNQNDISSALAIFDAEACKLGLRTSWAKTKIMKFGDVPSPPSLHICNNDVKFVDKFTYLGSIITNTGDLQPDINRRIGLATGVMRSLRQPLWRHSSISLETKLRVYQASVLSVLLELRL